jgi:hypothetical protein
MKRALRWIGGILGIFVVGFGWMAYDFKRSLEPKVSLDEYEEVVAKRAQTASAYSFFPPRIDPKAEKAAFYHIPGFLQGGDIVCLRQRLPQEEVAKLLSGLEKSGRTEVRDFGDIPAPHCYPEYELAKPTGNNLMEGVATLPDGFRIFLFNSDLEDIKKNWNHNFLAFTAVSLDAKEVVYFADNW